MSDHPNILLITTDTQRCDTLKCMGNPHAVATLYKSCALATKRWKLEYYFEEGIGRLFDRTNDPNEQTDLYTNPDYDRVRDELLRALLTWRSDLADVEWLQRNTTSGGPVAKRVVDRIPKMRGTDAEENSNSAVEKIETEFSDI